MNNLNLLKINNIKQFIAIVNCKHSDRKRRLLMLIPVISSRYKKYILNSPNLEKLDKTIIKNKLIVEDLFHCYRCETMELNKLKALIRNSQSIEGRSKCQYCGINSPDTFDHYLPKSEFPEYSVLPINLIPCCPSCNNIKGEKSIISGQRLFINLYFDGLPDDKYLFATINIKDDVPLIYFELKNEEGKIPNYIFKILNNHFSHLKLQDRYKNKIEEEISEIKTSVNCNKLVTRELIENCLKSESIKYETIYGANYWKTALYACLVSSPDFINILITKP